MQQCPPPPSRKVRLLSNRDFLVAMFDSVLVAGLTCFMFAFKLDFCYP